MNSLEILQIIANLPCRSMGVSPSDEIPKRWTRPSAMVFNTDGSKKPGSHWVAIYVDDQFRGWYFDSYGIKPYIPEHINRIRKNCKSLRWNVQQLQSYESAVCGHFCVMFLYFLSFGLGFDQFLHCFTSNLQENDDIARNFVSSLQKKTAQSAFIGNGSANQHVQTCNAKIFYL